MPVPGSVLRRGAAGRTTTGRTVRVAAATVAVTAVLGGVAACGSDKSVLNAPADGISASKSPTALATPVGNSKPLGDEIGKASRLAPRTSGIATQRPAAGSAGSGTSSGATPVAPAGWGPAVLADDFNGGAVNSGLWDVYDSPDAQQFPRSAARTRVSGGELQLVGGLNSAGKDVSGGLSTKLNLTYGRWEARVRVDRGAGYNATMLLWPLSDRWPVDGEIDVSEINSANPQDGGGHFVHFGQNNDWLGQRYHVDMSQWHVLAVEWTPDRIVFSVDGNPTFTVLASHVVNGASPVPHGPMHLALQNDVGCVDSMSCRNASTPAQVTMHVDWVRAYRYPG